MLQWGPRAQPDLGGAGGAAAAPAAALPTLSTSHEASVRPCLPRGAAAFPVWKRKSERTSQEGERWHQEHPRQCPTGSTIAEKHQDRVQTSCDGGKGTVLPPFGRRCAVKLCRQLDTASQMTGFCKGFKKLFLSHISEHFRVLRRSSHRHFTIATHVCNKAQNVNFGPKAQPNCCSELCPERRRAARAREQGEADVCHGPCGVGPPRKSSGSSDPSPPGSALVLVCKTLRALMVKKLFGIRKAERRQPAWSQEKE